MADDRRQAGEDLDLDAGSQGHGEEDGDGALEHVEDAGDEREPGAQGPHHVRAAGPAAPDRPRVRASGKPGDDDAPGDPADEVGRGHDGDGTEDGDGVHGRGV